MPYIITADLVDAETVELIVDEQRERTAFPVSSVRIRVQGFQEGKWHEHAFVRFWNRGGGTSSTWAIIQSRDAINIAARLLAVLPHDISDALTRVRK